MELRKATRKQAKLRIGLSAASGFGKTYSALLMAYGITGDWSKIAVIDTEHGSAELYSDLGEYNVLTLEAPFSPERYSEAIRACESGDMEVIIIDSITHEWDGKGGCLEIVESLGGRYQDWAKVTPRHQKFIDAILQSKCHVITTVRRKQDYSMSTDDRGKVKVEKAGLKEVTREGFEYELTLNFEIINDRHLVKASKDRTGLYMNRPEFVITEDTGKELKQWAGTGVSVIDIALKELAECDTKECTVQVWNKYPQLKAVDKFKDAVAEKGKSFSQTESAAEPVAEQAEAETPNRRVEEFQVEAAASEKQLDLLRNLVNSHHIPAEIKEKGAALLANGIQSIPQSDAKQLIDELTDLIVKGNEYEKSTPATEEQVEIIEMLLENEVFRPEEADKGKEKLKKGYSIAQAQKVIDSLEKELQKRGKEQPA